MKFPALFLDLDGTVRETISGRKFINHPQDQKLIDGAAKAIAYFANRDYIILGLTNQAGVRDGYKSLDDCVLEQFETLEQIPPLRQILFCPDSGKQLGSVTRSSPRIFPGEKFLVSKDTLDRIYCNVSPFEPVDRGHNFSSFRKPGSGMVEYLVSTYSIDVRNSLLVGDMDSDRQCVKDIDCGFLWAHQWRDMFGK